MPLPKETPIIFSTPMVQAIQQGDKTQTRRIIKPQPIGDLAPLSEWSRGIADSCHDHNPDPQRLISHSHKLKGRLFPFRNEYGDLIGLTCPYGKPGDLLWVRETFAEFHDWDHFNRLLPKGKCVYRANEYDAPVSRWKPSIFMPKKYTRIWLKIIDIRVEGLQDITANDCLAEGIDLSKTHDSYHPLNQIGLLRKLWDSINGKSHPWDSNPWVWVVEFEKEAM